MHPTQVDRLWKNIQAVQEGKLPALVKLKGDIEADYKAECAKLKRWFSSSRSNTENVAQERLKRLNHHHVVRRRMCETAIASLGRADPGAGTEIPPLSHKAALALGCDTYMDPVLKRLLPRKRRRQEDPQASAGYRLRSRKPVEPKLNLREGLTDTEIRSDMNAINKNQGSRAKYVREMMRDPYAVPPRKKPRINYYGPGSVKAKNGSLQAWRKHFRVHTPVRVERADGSGWFTGEIVEITPSAVRVLLVRENGILVKPGQEAFGVVDVADIKDEQVWMEIDARAVPPTWNSPSLNGARNGQTSPNSPTNGVDPDAEGEENADADADGDGDGDDDAEDMDIDDQEDEDVDGDATPIRVGTHARESDPEDDTTSIAGQPVPSKADSPEGTFPVDIGPDIAGLPVVQPSAGAGAAYAQQQSLAAPEGVAGAPPDPTTCREEAPVGLAAASSISRSPGSLAGKMQMAAGIPAPVHHQLVHN